MKNTIVAAALAVCAFGCGPAISDEKEADGGTTLQWQTDFEKATQAAKDCGLPILADFTGSDWCGWCIRLKAEVFGRKEFKEFAEKRFVLFVADFPAHKEQAEALKAQNAGLAERFGVKGFPTILLLNADGSVMARTGYRKGGAAAYVEHLEGLLKTGGH